MQRVFTTTIGRDPASKPNDHKMALTFTKGEKRRPFRLVGVATRKRICSITDVTVIPVDGRKLYPVQMLYGEELVVTVSANRCVTFLVSEKNYFEEWCKEEAEEYGEEEGYTPSYPEVYFMKEEVRAATTLHFYATEHGTVLVCVFNIASKKARAAIEVVHWSRTEEE